MHPTTAQYLAQARNRDIEADAAQARLVAEAREHDIDQRRRSRWGIRLPRLTPALRRGPAVSATTP